MLHTTAMREAFERAIIVPDANQKIGRIVVNAMAKHQKAGMIDFGKGWNASLSMRTYQALRVPCGL